MTDEIAKIFVVYTNDSGAEVKEEIGDLYWFEENHVHDLRPQRVNGYGDVHFEIERPWLYGVSYQDWMNIL